MKKQLATFVAAAVLATTATGASASLINYSVRSVTNSTFGNYQAGWNAQTSAITSNNLASFNGAIGGNSSYDHLAVSFDIGAGVSGSTLQFQLAPDAGYGGAVYVDGTLVFSNSNDLWWGGDWNNASQLLAASLNSIAAGSHTIDFYWAENCCNGGESGRFAVNGGAWEDLSVTNLNALNVPEPGSLALLGLGLTAAVAMRRRKA